MSLPPRVGAALVVLGTANGEAERSPDHNLTPPVYGPGIHEYFRSYPVTTPSNVVTKAWGLLGLTVGPEVTVTAETLPRNYFTIVCYKTEIQHWIPKLAWTSGGTHTAYDSTCVGDIGSPYFNDINAYNAAYSLDFSSKLGDSFENVIETTDIIEDPDKTPENLRHLFPRWAAEEAWDMAVEPYEDAVYITPTGDDLPYYLTSNAEGLEEDWVSPWYITFYDGEYQEVTRHFCDFSYSFTDLNPYNNRQPLIGTYGCAVADTNSNQWAAGAPGLMPWVGSGFLPIPTGAYLTQFVDLIYPWNKEEGKIELIDYQSQATHGLFLDAEACCWNLGTVVTLIVHIWKAPPKIVFRPPKTFVNWKQGSPASPADYYKRYNPEDQHYDLKNVLPGRCFGHYGSRHDPFIPGIQYVEVGGGPDGDGPFSPSEPNSQDLHYWGHIWGVDYDSPNCKEVDAISITITIDESNAAGDAAPTDWGTKVADIVLPLIEGYFTYIKDYEVVSITKAGEV
jgi:hypothetical protein